LIRFRRTRIRLKILAAKVTRRPRATVLRHEFNLWAENDRGETLEAPHRMLFEKSLEKMNLSAHDHILEVGCGGGWASHAMTERVAPDSRVVGIDISDGMIRRARARFTKVHNLNFICAGAESMPLSDASFTKIFCLEAFFFFEDQEKVLREMLRVATPGGEVFLIFGLHKDYPEGLNAVEEIRLPVHIRSSAEYQDMLRRTGWSEVRAETFIRRREPGEKTDVHDRALFLYGRKPAVAKRAAGA
jgi:ubiquinone/menaquinone biosynthesis C-methylase UbiE